MRCRLAGRRLHACVCDLLVLRFIILFCSPCAIVDVHVMLSFKDLPTKHQCIYFRRRRRAIKSALLPV